MKTFQAPNKNGPAPRECLYTGPTVCEGHRLFLRCHCKTTGSDAYLPQLSFSVVTRLNTGLPGWESTRSATK